MYSALADTMEAIAELLRRKQPAEVHVLGSSRWRDNSCLGIFPYWIRESPYSRSLERSPAELVLELKFLLLPLGVTSGVDALRLLGSGMQILHDHPVIQADLLEELRPADGALRARPEAGLIRCVTITPSVISLEDLTRLWNATEQQAYSLSAAYEVRIVPREQQGARSTAPPNNA